jgi:hypothetical protein
MSVFTTERMSAMRQELANGLATARIFQNAHFTAVLRAGEENLTIRLNGEESLVESADSPDAEFGLAGPADAWEGFLSGDGTVRHISPIGMILAEHTSEGVIANEMAPEGDLERLFANLPILSRLMESAARPHGALS